MQGLRYKNVQQLSSGMALRQSKAEMLPSTQAQSFHVEHVNKNVNITIPLQTSLNKQEQPCPNAVVPSKNEIEALLEATFGQSSSGKTRNEVLESDKAQAQCDYSPAQWHFRPLQDENTKEEDLPFISKEEIECKSLLVGSNGLIDESKVGGLWITVDDIVYDCSAFIEDHPGGKQVILSFVGGDCSWQFWRFHSKSEMQQYGRPLRIGRTAGIPNKYKEKPKYVGLHGLGRDECA